MIAFDSEGFFTYLPRRQIQVTSDNFFLSCSYLFFIFFALSGCVKLTWRPTSPLKRVFDTFTSCTKKRVGKNEITVRPGNICLDILTEYLKRAALRSFRHVLMLIIVVLVVTPRLLTRFVFVHCFVLFVCLFVLRVCFYSGKRTFAI